MTRPFGAQGHRSAGVCCGIFRGFRGAFKGLRALKFWGVQGLGLGLGRAFRAFRVLRLAGLMGFRFSGVRVQGVGILGSTVRVFVLLVLVNSWKQLCARSFLEPQTGKHCSCINLDLNVRTCGIHKRRIRIRSQPL